MKAKGDRDKNIYLYKETLKKPTAILQVRNGN